jgi:hypothetical protein
MSKLPFTFSLKLVFRLLLPGFVIALALLPALQTLLERLQVTLDVESAFLLSVVGCGWLVVLLDMPIYIAFEGRRYWPARLRSWRMGREEKRLQELQRERERVAKTDRAKSREISVELRRFPLDDDGEFYVAYPTRLGNLLAAYEGYPKRAYGMDAVFYWYRIWLTLDEEQREEIDSQQALVDSALYTAAALVVAAITSLAYLGHEVAGLRVIRHLPGWDLLLALAAASVGLGYVLYRGSLHLHAQFGETFKSVFDVYQKNIDLTPALEEIMRVTGRSALRWAPARERYRAAWRYLHNDRVESPDGLVSASKLAARAKPP